MGNTSSTVQRPKHDPFAALRIRDFSFFVLARFTLTMGILIQGVIVEWQVYEITKDALQLGLIGLAEALPFICIALFAGHVADIFSRRKVIIFATMFLVLGTAFLFFFSIDIKANIAHWGIYPIYIAIAITGLSRGFIGPSYSAFLAQLVPKEIYVNSATWSSSTWQVAAVAGPAIAGLSYGFIGPCKSYAVDAVLILASLFFILFIPPRPAAKKDRKESVMKSISAGIKFVFSSQVILGALSLDLFAVLFGGAVALLPIFSDQVLHAGPQGLGFLRSAPAIGAVIFAAGMTFFPIKKKAGRILLWSVGAFGVFTIAFALSKNFYLSFLMLAITGAVDNISVVIRSTILQLSTPDEMRGRVSSVNSVFIGSSNEIGAFESGAAAKLMGLIPSVVFGGVMTLLVVGATTKLAPKLREMDLD
jgi:MFS family permease